MIELTRPQAQAIVSLAYALAGKLTGKDVLVGIPTDGVPAVIGLEHSLYKLGHGKFKIGYVAASSNKEYPFVDMNQLRRLKQTTDRRIFVDWRTKTGSLGQLLRQADSSCVYAVLSDPNGRADMRGTLEDVPKIAFPEDLQQTMRIIGLMTRPDTLEGIRSQGGNLTYNEQETPESTQFYGKLLMKIDDIIQSYQSEGHSYVA